MHKIFFKEWQGTADCGSPGLLKDHNVVRTEEAQSFKNKLEFPLTFFEFVNVNEMWSKHRIV